MTNADIVGAGPALTDIITPNGPWAVRPARRRRGRAALEVYERGELLDVMVETRLDQSLVRGARREARRGGRWASFAWGRIPRDGVPPAVAFVGRLGRRRKSARVIPVAGAFWFACAEGSFHGVLVQPADGPSVRLRTEHTA